MCIYRVSVDDTEEGHGAYWESDNAAEAIYFAILQSHTITPEAALVGIVTLMLINEDMITGEGSRDRLAMWLQQAHVPGDMKELVELLEDSPVEPADDGAARSTDGAA